MIILALLLATLIGAVAGAAAARYWQHNLTPGARERQVMLDAVALLRELINNPDALTLRDRAKTVVDRFDGTQRKDI